jgi:hypothetical protein
MMRQGEARHALAPDQVRLFNVARQYLKKSYLNLFDSAELIYFAVRMRADALVFDIEIFLEGNLLMLTPVDRAEAAAKTITHPVTAPAAAITASATSIAAIVAAITVTIAE